MSRSSTTGFPNFRSASPRNAPKSAEKIFPTVVERAVELTCMELSLKIPRWRAAKTPVKPRPKQGRAATLNGCIRSPQPGKPGPKRLSKRPAEVSSQRDSATCATQPNHRRGGRAHLDPAPELKAIVERRSPTRRGPDGNFLAAGSRPAPGGAERRPRRKPCPRSSDQQLPARCGGVLQVSRLRWQSNGSARVLCSHPRLRPRELQR